MAKKSSKNKPIERPVFQKPVVPNFPGTKGSVNFQPTGRFQSINRSRR